MPVLLARRVITTWEKTAGIPGRVLPARRTWIAEQQATQAVFTGFLDRSVLYGVLTHMEMLGLDLVEAERVTKTERHPAPRNPA